MKHLILASIGALALMATGAYAAQYAYPAKGQDQATQAKDQAECTTWASQQTGYDPAKAPKPGAASTPSLNSAQTTALLGAVSSGLGSHAGGNLGAATTLLGSGGGNSLGGATTPLNSFGAQSSPATPAQPTPQAEFDRARSACLTGRGYTVQ